MTEIEKWRRLALYLADCHAANAEVFCARKSISACDKNRLLDICDKTELFIKEPFDMPIRSVDTDVYERTVSKRLKSVLEEFAGKLVSEVKTKTPVVDE